jgi:tetrathionate reductase subunit C
VHCYTGFILSFCSARPMWNSSMIPLLFLVSAVVSGTALMILVYAGWSRVRGEEIGVNSANGWLLFSLARILGWVLLADLILTGMEILVAWVSDEESRWAVRQLVSGQLAFGFLGMEIVLGKLVPLVLLFWPRQRKTGVILLASALIIAGILFMRLDLVRVGELLPLL